MPRSFFKRILPDPIKIQNASYMRHLKSFASNRQLWTTKRRNVVWGLAIGLFIGFQPIIPHVLTAIVLAIWLRANIPMAVAASLLNNPITLVPMYFLGYKVGCAILNVPAFAIAEGATKYEFIKQLISIHLQPLLLGCFVTGLFFALVASVGLNAFWKWNVLRRRKNRLFNANESARLEQDNVEHKADIK